ncbi:cadherin domain-containing protein, partial [Aliivibrio fischeri]|uniref:cadherin domain-containing protein n=1 Tax=Aliivibrio fischeri TaxID=668 RepID=UPI0020B1C039
MALNISASKEQLIVIDKNGNLKLINAGDKVLPGEILLNNGNENVSLDSNDIPEENKDIEEILNAIIDGEDPSLITEAPAAGEDSGSSLTTSIEIERTGESIIAKTDFDTSSLEAIGFSKTQSLTLLDQYKAYRDTGSFDNGITKDTKNSAISNIVDGDEKINAVSENITIGNKVNITGLAVDPDGDEVSYKLSDADIAKGLFAIDATTGVVTLIGNLDHEVADSHSITIIATSTDGSISQESFDIAVTDADGSTPGGGDTDNDVGPVTDSNAAENTLSENAEIGSVVNITGLAVDPDGDDVSYTLSDADIAKGLFAIDTTTGVVTLIGNLDHEVADSHSITIIATSTDGSTSQESFDITVTNADGSTPGGGDTDNDVGPVTDSNAADNTISENAEVGSVINITGLAIDPDGDDVTYELSQSDIDAGLFAIDATTGVVTLIGNLDHEVADSHSITIIATSTDGSTSEASFDITVTDADGSTPGGGDTDNDVGPVTDSNAAENTLSENAEIGTVVNITGLATDSDGDDVTYALSQSDIDAGLFEIDATTGVVTLIGALDHEVADSHSITIIATSTDGSTSQESFDI